MFRTEMQKKKQPTTTETERKNRFGSIETQL